MSRKLHRPSVRVDFCNGNVAIHRSEQIGVWGLFYILAGAMIGLYALTHVDTKTAGASYVGLIFGLLIAGAGIAWLRPAGEILLFDAAAQEVRDTRYGWRGRKVKIVPFAQVASIGVDTLKDPSTGVAWDFRCVLRLKDGNHLTIVAPDVLESLHQLTGFARHDQVLLCNEPIIVSS